MGARLNTSGENKNETNEEVKPKEVKETKRQSNYKIHINNIIVNSNSTQVKSFDKNDKNSQILDKYNNQVKVLSTNSNKLSFKSKSPIQSDIENNEKSEDKLFSLIDKIKECELEDDLELPECNDLLAIKKESTEFENNITFESKEKSPRNLSNKISDILSPIIKKSDFKENNDSDSDPIQIVKKLISIKNFVFLEGKVKFLYNVDIQELRKVKSSDYLDMYMFIDNSAISFYDIKKVNKITYNFPSLKSIPKFQSNDYIFDVFSNSEYTILNPLNLIPIEDFISFDLSTVKLVKTTKLLNMFQIIITGQIADDSFVNSTSNDFYFDKNSEKKDFETDNSVSKISNSKGIQTKLSNTLNTNNKSKKHNNPLFINIIASEDYSLMNKVISHLNNLVNIA